MKGLYLLVRIIFPGNLFGQIRNKDKSKVLNYALIKNNQLFLSFENGVDWHVVYGFSLDKDLPPNRNNLSMALDSSFPFYWTVSDSSLYYIEDLEYWVQTGNKAIPTTRNIDVTSFCTKLII
mgnify:CR=1 FL=1